MNFDQLDVPNTRTTGVDVGPASQFPTSGQLRNGSDAIVSGLQSISTGMSALAQKQDEERKQAATYASADREIKFNQDVQTLLYDPEAGFLARRGETALDTAPVKDQIEKLRQQYLQDLSDPDAARQFDLRSRVRAGSYTELIERHAAKVNTDLKAATADNVAVDAVNNAVRVYNDPAKVEEQIALALPLLNQQLRAGLKLGAVQTREKIREFEIQVYSAVLREYQARKQPTAGLAYLDSVSDVMGDKAAAWRLHLNSVADAQQKEAASAQAWIDMRAAATDEVTQRFDERKARDYFEALPAETKALARPTIERMVDNERMLQNHDDQERLGRLDQVIVSTGRLDVSSPDFTNLDDIGKRTALRMWDQHARVARGEQADARRVQNEADTKAKMEFGSLPPDEMTVMPDAQLRQRWPDARLEVLTNLRERARRVSEKGHAEEYGTLMQKVNKITSTFPNSKDRTSFAEQMSAWYEQQVASGKPPTDKQTAEKLGGALLMRDLPAGLTNPFGTDKATFQIKDDASQYAVLPYEKQTHPLAKQYLARPVEGSTIGRTPGQWFQPVVEGGRMLKENGKIVYERIK